MSTPYSPNGTYPTFPLTLPVDGEKVSKATLVDAILKPIIDATGTNAPRTWMAIQSFAAAIGIQVAPKYSIGPVTDSAGQVIDVSKPVWRFAPASVLRSVTVRHSTAPIPTAGQVVYCRADPGGAAAFRLLRENTDIFLTLGNDATDPACAAIIFDGTDWKVLFYGAHCTPGTAA